MAKPTILIVEDEKPIRNMLSFALSKAGLNIVTGESIAEAWVSLENDKPDLLLLDWMLPDETGISFLPKLRSTEQYAHLPVIMLTARAEESNTLKGFEVGADDYITKPFSPKELVARVQALLRRSAMPISKVSAEDGASERLEMGNIVIAFNAYQFKIDGHEVEVGRTVFKLMAYLLTHPDKVHTREKLLTHVWGDNSEASERTVDVHIRRLRQAMEPFGYEDLIKSVRGVGYMLQSKVVRHG